MSDEKIIDVAYGEGWDASRAAVLGPIGTAEAAGRDAAGEPYAVVLRPRDGAEVIVAHLHHARDYIGLWLYDTRGRRCVEVDLRRLAQDRLFLLYRRVWVYENDEAPEFAPDAARVTLHLRPDGKGRQIVEPKGDGGGSRHTIADLPEAQRWFSPPAFGQWLRLLPALCIEGAADHELRESADQPDDERAEPNWHTPEGLRPRHLDELFTAGARFSDRDEVYTVREPTAAGTLRLPSGRLVARDPTYDTCEQDTGFTVTVPPGDYPVQIASAGYDTEFWGKSMTIDEDTAVRILVSDRPTVGWEPALLDGQDTRLLREGEFYGFGVDSGTGAFVDAGTAGELGRRYGEGMANGTLELATDENGVHILEDPATGTNLIAYPSGRGDGSYPVWIGRDADGAVTCFVADMLILNDAELL
ncbi:DUF4241 domain-containing protein [Streptomyces sp. NPDC001406]|uniref:DUF4241 domain-containing protein n=1 Tax=Streptomyces sp. NPDC001406 TaxID=3364572 RepID=UPI0036A06585